MKAAFLLASNPKLFFKILVGEIKIKATRQLPKSPIQKKISGILFEFDFNYDPAIKRMYFGIYELETVEVMREILKTGDTFIDVGANIGYLTAIGGGLLERQVKFIALNPYLNTFRN